MPSRQFHTKRRHGCKQCKARRVKCDAGAPCQHCTRRQEDCSNLSSVPDETSVALILPSSAVPSHASPLEIKAPSSAVTGIALLGISNLELRLLNHYFNFVGPSISAHAHLQRMWQHEITQQAKTHSFLMHNILSTSAYHLSGAYGGPLHWQQEGSHDESSIKKDSTLIYSPPRAPSGHSEWQIQQSRQYELFALEHQNQEALCAASALLSLNALASKQNLYRMPAFQYQQSSPIDDWLEISALVRGVDAVVKSASISILDGALQPLLRHRRVEFSSNRIDGDVESQVKRLVSPHVLTALDGLAPAIEHLTSSESDRNAYHRALNFLRISFAIVAVNPGHESIVMVWSNLLDRQFFPYVERREPMALVLLAYWTVLFGTFQDRWWVGGLNTTILRHVAKLLIRLDEDNEEMKDGHGQPGDDFMPISPPESCLGKPNDQMVGKAKWVDLPGWPLRENGIQEL